MGGVSCALSPQRPGTLQLAATDLALLDKLKAALGDRTDVTLQSVYKKFAEFQRYNVGVSAYTANPSVKDLRRVARVLTIYQKLFHKEYNEDGKNGALMMTLALLRKQSPAEDKKLAPVPTEVLPVPTEWWEVNANLGYGFTVYTTHLALLELPDMVDDPRPFGQELYDKLLEGKPMVKCQKTKDQMDWFLKNFDALCVMKGTKKTLDLNFYKKYEVRPGHHRYGGSVVVNGKDIIINGFKPSDGAKYEEAKWTWLATFGMHTVIVTHGNAVHIAIMQKRLLEVLEDKDLQTLATKNKEFNVLVQILTTGVNEINMNYKLLAGYGRSIGYRAASFTIDSIDACQRDMDKEWRALSNKQVVDRLTSGAPKWSSGSKKAYQLCSTLITSIVPKGTLSEETVSSLTLMLFTSAFYHTFIGDLQSENVLLGHCNLVCTGKPHVQTRAIATMNGTFENLILKRSLSVDEILKDVDLGKSKQAWQTFNDQMKKVDTGIDGLQGMLQYPAVNF